MAEIGGFEAVCDESVRSTNRPDDDWNKSSGRPNRQFDKNVNTTKALRSRNIYKGRMGGIKKSVKFSIVLVIDRKGSVLQSAE
jgi:hypothetical protein